MDYHRLLQRGIRLAQQLAGATWTDYNEHDPGVTILQQLCYALTDLGYRIDYPIEDILAENPTDPGSDSFHRGDLILTSEPLTADDYRALIYDRIDGVDNAWVVPASHPQGIRGLYDVLLEISEPDEATNETGLRIVEETRELLAAHRGLGEDIHHIGILKPFLVTVRGSLVIHDQADPVETLAEVLTQIQARMAPDPVLRLVDDMLAAGLAPEDIFVGPRLEYGVVQPGGLAELPREISVGRIRNAILGVAGVRSVRQLRIDGAEDGRLALPEGKVPYLSPSVFKPLPPGEDYPLTVETETGTRFYIDRKRIWRALRVLLDEPATYDYLKLENSEYLKPIRGNPRRIAHYFSIQHDFPVAYGMSRFGVPEDPEYAYGDSAPEEAPGEPDVARRKAMRRRHRQALAQQLKAYLLFFEQLLANGLAQLARAPELFSLDAGLDRTYFSLPIAHYPTRDADPPDILEILTNPRNRGIRSGPPLYSACIVRERPLTGLAGGAYPATMEILLKSREAASEEEYRQRIDEMLAVGSDSSHYQFETTVMGEIRLLLVNTQRHVIAGGEERFVSASQARRAIEELTGYLDEIRRHPALRGSRIMRLAPRVVYGVRVIERNGRVLLNSYELPSEDERERRVQQILANGVRADNYQVIHQDRGEFSVRLHDRRDGTILAHGENRYTVEALAEEEIMELVERLKKLRANDAAAATYIQRLPESSGFSDRRIVEEYRNNLAEIVREPESVFLRRRNHFLDHLLARFNERFDDESLLRLDPRYQWEKNDFYRELIRWKTDFLRRYPELSGARGRGADYSSREETTDSPAAPCPPEARPPERSRASGLEQRLSLLLGVEGHIGNGEYQAASKPLYLHAPPDEEDFCEAPEGDAGFAGEGLYVVEHILLRPRLNAAAESDRPPPDEFYSHRLSLVLPEWPARFRSAGFRSFAENLIRENCPAHILCRCYWLNAKLMYVFERLFQEWESLKLNSGDPLELESVAEALKTLLCWLEEESAGAEGEETAKGREIPVAVRRMVAKIERRRPGAKGSGPRGG